MVQNFACTYVHLNFFETSGRINMKVGTIDHCSWVSAIKVCHAVIESQQTINFFNLQFLTEENGLLLKQKPASNLSIGKDFSI